MSQHSGFVGGWRNKAVFLRLQQQVAEAMLSGAQPHWDMIAVATRLGLLLAQMRGNRIVLQQQYRHELYTGCIFNKYTVQALS
jgi:hypothetical protein